MKTFYTERDIVDMHATGTSQIEVNADVVLTDLAREKANELSMALVTSPVAPPSSALAPAVPRTRAQLVDRVKARVIARLGTDAYNDLLDQVIPQLITQLNLAADAMPSPKSGDGQATQY